jgi:hypothetical protein
MAWPCRVQTQGLTLTIGDPCCDDSRNPWFEGVDVGPFPYHKEATQHFLASQHKLHENLHIIASMQYWPTKIAKIGSWNFVGLTMIP